MVTPELIEYIKKNLKSGFHRSVLIQNLTAQGWSQKDVEQALTTVEALPPEVPKEQVQQSTVLKESGQTSTKESSVKGDQVLYAEFLPRLVALFIDTVIILFVFNFSAGLFSTLSEMWKADWQSFILLTALFPFVGIFLYFILMESSSKQGTLGKMAVGIKVTDMKGVRISVGRSAGRFFVKVFSGMFFGIGYLMVIFTAKKQGLHDIIAETLVIKK